MSTDSTDEDVADAPGPSNRLRVRPLPSRPNNSRSVRASTRWRHARDPQQPFNWKLDCKNLLHLLWVSEDSEPFRLVEIFSHLFMRFVSVATSSVSVTAENALYKTWNFVVNNCQYVDA